MSDADNRDGQLAHDAQARRSDPVEAIPPQESMLYETDSTVQEAREAADPSRHQSIEAPGEVPEL